MGVFSLFSCIAGFMISDTPGGGDPLTDPSAYKTLKAARLGSDIPQGAPGQGLSEAEADADPLR